MKFPSQGCGWRAAQWEFMQTDEWMEMQYEPDTPLFDLAMHEMEENGLRKTKQFEEFSLGKGMEREERTKNILSK